MMLELEANVIRDLLQTVCEKMAEMNRHMVRMKWDQEYCLQAAREALRNSFTTSSKANCGRILRFAILIQGWWYTGWLLQLTIKCSKLSGNVPDFRSLEQKLKNVHSWQQ